MEFENLREILGTDKMIFRPGRDRAAQLDAVIGWGHKPTARVARQYAKSHQRPYWAIEDGFLRSVDLGPKCPPLSLVVDKLGIYYDASSPSALEEMLEAAGANDPLADSKLIERSRRCRERILEARLSKYNHTSDEMPPELLEAKQPVVLVVDQTWGDASVDLGQCGPEQFSDMLTAACAENPNATIFLKTHPDTIAGKKRGYFTGQTLPPSVRVLAAAINPLAVLSAVDRIYVGTSQLGFEALLLDKAVTCFGVPFYAGWGLTDDRSACNRRSRTRTIDELVAAALILYPRYVHPLFGGPASVEDVIEHLALQRQRFRENQGRIFCFGISAWKRPFVRRYLHAPGNDVRFFRSVKTLEAKIDSQPTRLLTWGSRGYEHLLDLAQRRNVSLLRMEDGFIRSVGLGSDLTAPGSLVVDAQGIYYDPRQPSDLEIILETREFSAAELGRAQRLRERIVESGISKYNTVPDRRFKAGARSSQTVVLVPGQVEDDASVTLGSPVVHSNRALLEAVRALRPEAHIIYKPHPDVVSGNRKGRLLAIEGAPFDELVTDVPIGRCLGVADEVHTMTSLVGFEALLRGKHVVTHGQPFYAGWGLTEDREPISRRKRRLQLDELVAGAMLVYPRYYHFPKLAFCTAEEMLAEMEIQRSQGKGQIRLPWLLRRAYHLVILAREMVRVR
jgi:capsular polysaccharide export protein